MGSAWRTARSSRTDLSFTAAKTRERSAASTAWPSSATEALKVSETSRPAEIFDLPGGHLGPGAPADVTVIDPEARWTVRQEGLRSRSKNSPFAGWEVVGRAALTVVGGKVVHAVEAHRG